MAKDNGMLCDIDENLLFPNVNKLYKVLSWNHSHFSLEYDLQVMLTVCVLSI